MSTSIPFAAARVDLSAPLALIGCFLGVALLSALLCRLAIAWANRLHFHDHPGERKLQEAPVPLLGGVAIIAAVVCGGVALLCGGAGGAGEDLPILVRWLAAGSVLLVVGLADDRRGLSPMVRLIVQAAVTCAFAPELAAWLGGGPLRVVAFAVGGVWVLGLINSLNFLDNMDGASAGAGVWISLALALIFHQADRHLLCAASVLLAAALSGFLWWNRPSARLYMGDAGSTFLGFSVAVFALLAVLRAGLSPWLAPLLLAVPLYDTCTVFWIRWREGRPLWVGDRRHMTHRLTDRGRSVRGAIAILNIWAAAAAGGALLAHRAGRFSPAALGAAAAIAMAVFAWERRAEKKTAAGFGD